MLRRPAFRWAGGAERVPVPGAFAGAWCFSGVRVGGVRGVFLAMLRAAVVDPLMGRGGTGFFFGFCGLDLFRTPDFGFRACLRGWRGNLRGKWG